MLLQAMVADGQVWVQLVFLVALLKITQH